jgi:hypothetical protein
VGGDGWEDRVKQDVTEDFLGVELQGDNPLELAAHWASVTDCPIAEQAGHPCINFNNVTLRFVPVTDGRGPGLGGLDIKVSNREAILQQAHKRKCYVSDERVDICGTRFYLKD